ncbi:MAG: hypothetical protein ACI9KN_002502 [Gammaproteobacteria bacterium]|jgi:hypothetical protein
MTRGPVTDKIVVTSIALKTPLAEKLELNAAVFRAGLSAYEEFPGYYLLTTNEEDDDLPCIAVFDPQIAEFGWERLTHLVEEAFLSFVGETGFDRNQFQQGAIWFALPEPGSVVDDLELRHKLLPQLINRFSISADCDVSGVQMGATGVAYLVNKARRALFGGQFKFILIVAVDSCLLDGRISLYDQQW